MFALDRNSQRSRRSFIKGILRVGGAGIALSALSQSEMMGRPAYAQHGHGHDHGNGNGSGSGSGGVAPEISAGAAVGALALMSGGALLLSDRLRRRNRTK